VDGQIGWMGRLVSGQPPVVAPGCGHVRGCGSVRSRRCGVREAVMASVVWRKRGAATSAGGVRSVGRVSVVCGVYEDCEALTG
jgi:hypothetical protein